MAFGLGIKGKPLTEEQWKSGAFYNALLGQSRKQNSFTPYQPPPIPSGYYDPSLDAQRQAASRGLLSTEQDVGTAGRRAGEDLGYQQGQLTTRAGDATWDLTTTRDRTLQDIGFARSDEGVDYGRNVEMLTRQYGQLGRRQAEQARRYGVSTGGIALLSAAKRAENEGLERRDLDTGHERATRGFDTATSRTGEDYESGAFRVRRDLESDLGRTGTLYDRGVADRGDVLSRARSEDQFYGLDVGAQKSFQAQQAGYDAPTGPANEKTLPSGQVVRETNIGGVIYQFDPSGKVVGTRRP